MDCNGWTVFAVFNRIKGSCLVFGFEPVVCDDSKIDLVYYPVRNWRWSNITPWVPLWIPRGRKPAAGHCEEVKAVNHPVAASRGDIGDDMVLVLGAGDISDISGDIVERIKAKIIRST